MQDAGGWYFIVAGGQFVTDFEHAQNRWSRGGLRNFVLEGNAYEIRFTNEGGKAWDAFTSGAIVDVPFELWFLGQTPMDAADDVRMIPLLFDDDFNGVFSFKLDHKADEGNDDPYSDWIYFYMPLDSSPGESGYNQWLADDPFLIGPEHLARVVLMNWDETQFGDMPEPGTTFRLTSNDVPPQCSRVSIMPFPPVSFDIGVRDGTGVAGINVLETINSTAFVSPFNTGDQMVIVTVTEDTPDSRFNAGAVLELVDVAGNTSLCQQELDLPGAFHNVGNSALLVQDNSNLGAFANQGLPGANALWPGPDGLEHLFIGNLWVGAEIAGEKRVMDNHYGPFDWTPTDGSRVTVDADVSDQDISVEYDDHLAIGGGPHSSAIGLHVRQESFQWARTNKRDFIVFSYTIKNTGQERLNEVFAALWLDPDIPLGTVGAANNRVGYDPEREMLYTYNDSGDGGHLGLKVLGEAPYSRKGYSGTPASDEDKFDNFLTEGFLPLPDIVADVRMLITAQPFPLNPGKKSTVLFGLVFGEDLAAMQANADRMDRTFRRVIAK
jgi:hypothetical protein